MAAVFLVGDKELKHNFNLVQRDGTLNTKTIGFLKDAFGWDGVDFGALQDGDYSQYPVEVVLENEPGRDDQTKTYTVIRYVNKPGSGNEADLPAKADAKSLAAKYGAKFRAVSGPVQKPAAKPAPTQAAPAAAAPSAKTPPKRPAAPAAKVSDEGACWAKVQEIRKSEPEEAQAAFFWDVVAKVCGDRVADITPQEWGKVMELLNSELPF